MSLEKKLKDKSSEIIYLQQEIDYLKRKLYDNQQELETTMHQKDE
jgi:FtsZ-binding cell division protein ZapB